jgi:hypothetical protein
MRPKEENECVAHATQFHARKVTAVETLSFKPTPRQAGDYAPASSNAQAEKTYGTPAPNPTPPAGTGVELYSETLAFSEEAPLFLAVQEKAKGPRMGLL